MLHEGRIPLLAAEHDALDALIQKNPDASVSATRRDPGETGPLLVQVDGNTFLVSDDGRARKQRGS